MLWPICKARTEMLKHATPEKASTKFMLKMKLHYLVNFPHAFPYPIRILSIEDTISDP